MPVHDIIDNRTEKLVDHLSQMHCSCERARFAVGYLFLSGLTSVAKRLLSLKELRLLIGNTTNRETVEMLAEGYRHLDLAAEEVERQAYPKRTEAGKMTQETAGNLLNALELMDETDEAQALIAGLIQMIRDSDGGFVSDVVGRGIPSISRTASSIRFGNSGSFLKP